ncbi:Fatty acid amide hydrolase [Platanthera guangdongensis]|uniref:Fatty acid amide hydrolase n=1 Tax=Platanthera guangdongensis TaxID=2320717 RepID=A0ABR2MVR8_9ASPA
MYDISSQFDETQYFGPTPEIGVAVFDENDEPITRVEKSFGCLRSYDPNQRWHENSPPFLYWSIRDFAHAYRSMLATPSAVAENIIAIVEEYNNKKPPMPLLTSFSAEEVRKQAAASTQRFAEGNSLSILDGIFMAIKDDIDCYPHPSKSGTSWLHNARVVKNDAVCVSRLRSCGVILIGKANMHELGMGTTGNNPIHGTTRNPHSFDRYTGGSSSGPAALIASGLCSAAVGTDGGGSIRIPSSLCGIVGLKATYGRIDMKGSVCDCGTVEVSSPLAATVEDAMIVYAAMAGSSLDDRISLRPSPICLPDLSSANSSDVLRSMRLGKYSEWFNDVYSTEISSKCEDILNRLAEIFGCSITEIVLPELHEMQTAHVVSIGSESLCALNPDCEDGRDTELSLDTQVSLALFRSFTAADYVAAQRLRRRIMYYYMEAFKKVDIIVTPTTGCLSGRSNDTIFPYMPSLASPGNSLLQKCLDESCGLGMIKKGFLLACS